jgi:hypothetical protein
VEFVKSGAPATLKMVEMMLDSEPAHPGLLLTACSGFAQYAYAFLHVESEIATTTGASAAARELSQRGVRMYARARGYCQRTLATRHRELADALARDPRSALPRLDATTREDVPALFWMGVAWAGELALADNQLSRISELAVVRALFTRALALDEAWEGGAIHEPLIVLDGLPRLLGGSVDRARQHYDRAVALSQGRSASVYVTMASSVALPARDRPGFERLLKQALAVDVSKPSALRLPNLVAQKRARAMLANADRLFR